MDYILGVDLGTSGTKTVLYNSNGQAVASHTVEYPMYQPKNGWAEQNPEHWLLACYDTINNVVEKSDINPNNIKGMGISGQMHGLVMLDKNGDLIRDSIIWCDGRTAEQCEYITNTIGKDKLIEISANPALTGFTASKILWVKQYEPENYAKCRHILLPKDYVRYKLTGQIYAEYSDASGTNLLDVSKRIWSNYILDKLGIEESLLGQLCESQDIAGYITKSAAEKCGLYEGMLVVAGAGDNAAAAIGNGVVSQGKAFTTFGTSGVIFAHSDTVTIDPQGRVHTFCSALPNAWTIMSCTLAAGLSYRWLRDTVFELEILEANKRNTDPYIIMNELAEKSPIGSNKLIFLPYLMGERSPLLDEKARGAFIGLSAIHTKNDIARSVLEGISYSQKSCYDIINSMGICIDDMLCCGGGARSKLWRQMLADLYACEVKTASASMQGPALGVAILAGVASGIFTSIQSACKTIVIPDSITSPNITSSKNYMKYYDIYSNLYPALKDNFANLFNLS